jgi:hypothetical protein
LSRGGSFSVSPSSKNDRARRGRYAFSTTIDVPNPIFARMAGISENGHIREEDGGRKKQSEAKEPSAGKPKSKGLRYKAALWGIEIGMAGI